jgi:hypothetical protein
MSTMAFNRKSRQVIAGRLSARSIRPGSNAEAPCLARHREAGRRRCAAFAMTADVEGRGLRRLYVDVDRGNLRALSGGRRVVLLPVALLGLLAVSYVTRGESPRSREVDAGAGRRLDPTSSVRAVRRHRPWRRRSSCPMSGRERRIVGNARGARERPERVGFERVAGSVIARGFANAS